MLSMLRNHMRDVRKRPTAEEQVLGNAWLPWPDPFPLFFRRFFFDNRVAQEWVW